MTKILLVEDDKSLREIYGVRLLAEGYDIVSAGDGEEALAMAIKDRPNLIISDVMMPKISGFDMLDILRSTTETRDIKVIMMTALSSDDQRERGESLGADRYLVKSQVGIEDVVRTVHEVLADAPVAAPAPSFGTPAPAVGMRPAPAAQPAPRPAAPDAQPTQAPAAAPAVPTFTQPAPAPAGLPQPTAPFSTGRPANLGDRVIHPPEHDATTGTDLNNLIAQELGAASEPAPSPFGTPGAPAAPNPFPPAPSLNIPPTPVAPASESTMPAPSTPPTAPSPTPVQPPVPPSPFGPAAPQPPVAPAPQNPQQPPQA